MTLNMYVRRFMIALAGIVVGLMSVSLAFDFALYTSQQSAEIEREATNYYHVVRTSFVPIIVVCTLIGLVVTTAYRMVFVRNWRTYLLAIGVFSLSIYYVAVVFALEDNLPNVTDFEERVASLIQIGFAHLMTWLAGWFTIILLLFEREDKN